MTFELSIKSQIADSIVKEIVASALKSQAKMARFRYEQFRDECEAFEHNLNLTSEEFLRQFNAGQLGDAEEFFDWFAAIRGRDVWQQKAQVLAEVAL